MPDEGGRQRLDRYLWHARFVRTRAAAVELVAAGHVRVNGQRVQTAARPVRPGDILTIALSRTVLVVRVLGFSERRGGAPEARALYESVAGQPPDAS